MILQTSQIVVISIKISIAVISRRQRAAMMVGLGGAGARGGPPEAAIAAALARGTWVPPAVIRRTPGHQPPARVGNPATLPAAPA